MELVDVRYSKFRVERRVGSSPTKGTRPHFKSLSSLPLPYPERSLARGKLFRIDVKIHPETVEVSPIADVCPLWR